MLATEIVISDAVMPLKASSTLKRTWPASTENDWSSFVYSRTSSVPPSILPMKTADACPKASQGERSTQEQPLTSWHRDADSTKEASNEISTLIFIVAH